MNPVFENDSTTPPVTESTQFRNANGGSASSPENDQWLTQYQMESWYVDPIETAIIREADGLPQIDPEEFNRWLSALSPERRSELDATRQARTELELLVGEVHQKLTALVPELYHAKLPPELEERLEGSQYAIGFNQTMAETIDEASKYLGENGGVDVTGYNLDQRFLMFDHTTKDDESIARAIEQGYTGFPSIGRFIAVFPIAKEDVLEPGESITFAAATYYDVLPPDLEVSKTTNEGKRDVVNSKYIAGFIDGTGEFWVNNNFTINETPQFKEFNK